MILKTIIRKGCLLALLAIFFVLFESGCKNSKSATETKDNNKSLKEKYAAILGVPTSEIQNVTLYKFIDEWYGVPYKYGGKSKDGVDCSGFTSILQSRVYNKTIEGSAASIFNDCKPLSQNELKEGDLVFFKISGDKISHVGVYLQNRKFVHASTKKGVIINSLDEDYYRKYYYKGGRIK
ncbi:MAG: NlpC/P60 family protein [Bacteroidia bacterium]